MKDELLDYGRISAKTGIKPRTLRIYQAQANRRREDGNPKPGDMPPPDQVFGYSPVWLESTVDNWLESRPGQGVGGAAARERYKRERAAGD